MSKIVRQNFTATRDLGEEITQWNFGNKFTRNVMEKKIIRRIKNAPDAGYILKILGTMKSISITLVRKLSEIFKQALTIRINHHKDIITTRDKNFAMGGLVEIDFVEFVGAAFMKTHHVKEPH